MDCEICYENDAIAEICLEDGDLHYTCKDCTTKCIESCATTDNPVHSIEPIDNIDENEE